MKTALILSTALALTATSAFAQSDETPDAFAETEIYLNIPTTDAPMSAELADTLRQEFERSRTLKVEDIDSGTMMRIIVPTSMTLIEDPKGQRLSIKYEIALPQGSGQSQTATCAVKKLNDCARAAVTRVEKFVRDNKPQ